MTKKLKTLFQKGISLLEVMLSLSIIAIILVMAVRYYGVSTNSDNTNIDVQQMSNLVGAEHQYKAITGNYATTFDPLCSYGLVPAKNLSCTGGACSSCSMNDPFGNGVNLNGGNPVLTIKVTMTNAPGACNQLANALDNASCTDNAFQITLS